MFAALLAASSPARMWRPGEVVGQSGSNISGYLCYLVRWFSVCCQAWTAWLCKRTIILFGDCPSSTIWSLAPPYCASYLLQDMYPNTGPSHKKIKLSYWSEHAFPFHCFDLVLQLGCCWLLSHAFGPNARSTGKGDFFIPCFCSLLSQLKSCEMAILRFAS